MFKTYQIEMPAKSGHIPSLDGLRAISIFLVLTSHLITPKVPGGYGVFLFFVISGYLITRLMFQELNANKFFSLAGFYKRRIFRLYPIIFIYSILIVITSSIPLKNINYLEPLSALFYFANYLCPHYEILGLEYQMPFKIFWSLSVEEHFYFVFPILFIIFRGLPYRIATLSIVVIISVFLLRAYYILYVSPIPQGNYMYMRTEFRADSIAYGVLLASLCELRWGRKLLSLADSWFAATICLLFLFIVATLPNPFKVIFRDVLMGSSVVIGISAILFGNKFYLLATLLNFKPISWIGKISYSLYVWHLPVDLLVQKFMPGYWLVSVVASIAIATFSYYFIELPFIKLGRRIQF
jgi:peptidoglycan/LPS O-acetylase OafA/YrhL